VIPRACITAWRSEAPWASDAQVEQDLVLSKALVELSSICGYASTEKWRIPIRSRSALDATWKKKAMSSREPNSRPIFMPNRTMRHSSMMQALFLPRTLTTMPNAHWQWCWTNSSRGYRGIPGEATENSTRKTDYRTLDKQLADESDK